MVLDTSENEHEFVVEVAAGMVLAGAEVDADDDALVISKDLAPNDNLIGWFVGGRRAEEMRRVAALPFAFPSIVAAVWGRVCEHPATGEVRVVIFVRWCLHDEEEADGKRPSATHRPASGVRLRGTAAAPALSSSATARPADAKTARADALPSMPPMMLAPERLVPGTSARHCSRPTISAPTTWEMTLTLL